MNKSKITFVNARKGSFLFVFGLSVIISTVSFGQSIDVKKHSSEAFQKMEKFRTEISEVSGYSSDAISSTSSEAVKELFSKMISSLNEAVSILQSAEESIKVAEKEDAASKNQASQEDLAEALADIRELNTETNRVLRKVREATTSETPDEMKIKVSNISKILNDMNETIATAEASLNKVSGNTSKVK